MYVCESKMVHYITQKIQQLLESSMAELRTSMASSLAEVAEAPLGTTWASGSAFPSLGLAFSWRNGCGGRWCFDDASMWLLWLLWGVLIIVAIDIQ